MQRVQRTQHGTIWNNAESAEISADIFSIQNKNICRNKTESWHISAVRVQLFSDESAEVAAESKATLRWNCFLKSWNFWRKYLCEIYLTHWAQEGYWPIHCQWLDILDLRVCHQDKTFLLKELKWNNGLFWTYSAKKAWHMDFYCFVQCKIQILIFITL